MDTTGPVGGFRRPAGTRLALAVSANNEFNGEILDVPWGYRRATAAEGQREGAKCTEGGDAFVNKGGWNGYTWNGKERHRFAFSDTALLNGPWQHAGNTLGTLHHDKNFVFAGVVCIEIDTA
eukprot:NODE_24248_length_632_cov_3.823762.p1 GENE.NODE_24248_length_632_cov_3.823762~~NODE_24248_length_632_cov_3.823762.p1  ORF type:complete len:143 (+),score=12.31 NODE_24248_length_632_cov_3.823762:66-431(+)